MLTPSSLDSTPTSRNLAPVLTDERVIMHLIDELLSRSGLSVHELAKRLGVQRSTINQYRYMRRTKPSVKWLVRLVDVCGGRIWVEFPDKPLKDIY